METSRTVSRERENAGKPWLYVMTGFVALIFGVNTVNVLFNVLAPSLLAEFGWNRLQISAGLSIFTVTDGIGLFALGFLIDKYGIRIATPMALLFGIGIMLLSLVKANLTTFYVICAVIGAGAGAVTPTVYSVVVTAWFARNRGLALGILNVGLGLCGTITPFTISALLHRYGWRGALLAMGALGGILPFLAYQFVLRMPKAWEAARLNAKERGQIAGVPLASMLGHRPFWLICLAVFFVSAATYGMMSQMTAMTVDRGFSSASALSVLSVVSLSSIASRFVVGALLDRLFAPVLTAVIFLACTIGVLIMNSTHSLTMLYAGAICIGLGLGSEGDIAAYILSRYVPKEVYARCLGIVMFLFAQGGALGIFVLSSAYTVLGSYRIALVGIAAAVVVAAVLVLFLGPYRYGIDGDDSGTGGERAVDPHGDIRVDA